MARRPVEAALARTQREQFGAFSRTQAREAGLPRATIEGRVRAGRYRILQPGVYCEAGTPETWELRAMAAVLWAGADAVLARGSAARVHGLPLPRGGTDQLRLLVATRCFDHRPGVVVHRTRRLFDAHATALGPLPVTTVTRTVCDLASELGPSALRRLVAAAVRDGHTDATILRSHLAELGRIRGKVALTHLVDELSPLDGQCRSPFETSYLRLARLGGVAPTAMNHPVRDRRGRRRYLDAVHLPERLPIELDSARFHSISLDRHDDRAREEDLEIGVAWHPVLRVTYEDVHERPDAVVARVRAELAAIRSGARPPLSRPARLTPAVHR